MSKRPSFDITTKSIYDEMIKGEIDITSKDFMKFIKILNETVMEEILHSKIVRFPYNLGTIVIVGKKLKVSYDKHGNIIIPKLIDYGATKKLRKELFPDRTEEDWKKVPLEDKVFVYMENYHTDNYRYQFKWSAGTRLAGAYKFKAVRWAKRELAKKLKDINDTTKYIKTNEYRKLYKNKHNITKSL